MGSLHDEACKLFVEGDIDKAYTVCDKILKQSDKQNRETLILFLMLCYLKGKVGIATSMSNKFRDLLRNRGNEDVTISFLVGLGADLHRRFFLSRFGVDLPIYDMEIIYTTEDEVLVPRTTTPHELTNHALSLDFFWKCVVDGSSSAIEDFIQLHPSYDVTRITPTIGHKKAVMDTFNKLITNNIMGDDTVLDLASGGGQLGYLLYDSGKHNNITMVDIHKEQIEICNQYFDIYFGGHNVSFVEGDILDYDNLIQLGTFDVIVACDIVEHLYNEEFEKLLKTVLRMLNKGGRFYIQTPDGLRYFGNVVDENNQIIQGEFFGGPYKHVSEKTMGYFKKILAEHNCRYKILSRDRIVLEVTAL